LQQYNYYTGQATSVSNMTDPNDQSGQFALDMSQYYPQQPVQQQATYQQQQFPMNQPMQYQQPNYPQQQPMWNNGYGYQQQSPMMNNGYGYQQQPMMNSYQQPQMQPWGYQAPQPGAPMNTPTMQVGNPVFRVGTKPMGPMTQPVGTYNPYTQQAMFAVNTQPQDKVVHVPGYAPFGSAGVLSDNLMEQCEQMQVDMMVDMEKAIAAREARSQGTFYNNGWGGYFGYQSNPYFDQGVYNQYMDKVKEMANSMMVRRKELSKGISQMVHSYLNDGVTEEQINDLYDGYTYIIPGSTIQEQYNQNRFARMKPFNNAYLYQKHSEEVSKAYHMLAPAGRNMNEFFEDCGMLILADKLEQQCHVNRDTSRVYNGDAYHRYLRKYAAANHLGEKQKLQEELERRQKNLVDQIKQGDFSNLPTTHYEAAKMLLGDKAAESYMRVGKMLGFDVGEAPLEVLGPPDQYGTPVTDTGPILTDEEEAKFNMRRDNFVNSIWQRESYAERNYKGGIT